MALPSLALFALHLLTFWSIAIGSDFLDGRLPKTVDDARIGCVLLRQFTCVWPTFLLLFTMTPVEPGDYLPLRILVGVLTSDIAGHTLHRGMHQNRNLRMLHAQHHRPLVSAMQALDASPFEVIALNIMCNFLPFALIGVGHDVLQLLCLAGTAYSVLTHSVWFGAVRNHGHDFHHTTPTTNFSTFLIADYLFDTLYSADRAEAYARTRLSSAPSKLLEMLRQRRQDEAVADANVVAEDVVLAETVGAAEAAADYIHVD